MNGLVVSHTCCWLECEFLKHVHCMKSWWSFVHFIQLVYLWIDHHLCIDSCPLTSKLVITHSFMYLWVDCHFVRPHVDYCESLLSWSAHFSELTWHYKNHPLDWLMNPAYHSTFLANLTREHSFILAIAFHIYQSLCVKSSLSDWLFVEWETLWHSWSTHTVCVWWLDSSIVLI